MLFQWNACAGDAAFDHTCKETRQLVFKPKLEQNSTIKILQLLHQTLYTTDSKF